MPGRQLNFSIRGEQYEKAFDAIASRFLSVVSVPRPADYGVDFYCHVRRPLDPKLYFARVTTDCSRVDFYSLWHVWTILGGSSAPFRIVCELDDPSDDLFVLPEPTQEAGGQDGDGMTYTLRLGPPFLSISQNQFSNPGFDERATALMSKWIRFDRLTVIMLLLRVASIRGVREWFTNDFELTKPVIVKEWMAFSGTPGQNIKDICDVFEPVATNLGTHLQHQNDVAAYRLIPALEWLRASGWLSTFGEGLLGHLLDTQARGEPPLPG